MQKIIVMYQTAKLAKEKATDCFNVVEQYEYDTLIRYFNNGTQKTIEVAGEDVHYAIFNYL